MWVELSRDWSNWPYRFASGTGFAPSMFLTGDVALPWVTGVNAAVFGLIVVG